jgi:hypothetical protein
MDSALLIHRLHFAFTITFHYLFPAHHEPGASHDRPQDAGTPSLGSGDGKQGKLV